MGFFIKFLRWVWKAIGIFAPIASLLWAVSIYGGLALSLYVIVDQTASVINGFSVIFGQWADGLNQSIAQFFSAVNDNSTFSFLAYIFSLDVPIEWFRSCSDSFLRFWLTWVMGTIVGVVEICVVVLGVMWLRSRMKIQSTGMTGVDSGGFT